MLEKNQLDLKKFYSKYAVSSIIFGAAMADEHKKFITENIPFSVKFKEIEVNDSELKLKDL